MIVRALTSVYDVSAAQWNALVGERNPFLEYEFFEALEHSGATGLSSDWMPRYIACFDKETLVGLIPAFIRHDSYGEFSMDWEWAAAYTKAELPYYPKLTITVPFTPVTGERILVHKAYPFETVATAMVSFLSEDALRQGLSSIHFLFLTKKEQEYLTAYGFMPRMHYQFHWKNREYRQFDDFLADLRSSKRKQIKKERNTVNAYDLSIELVTGDAITPRHMEAVWQFYLHTHSRKWGQPYLNQKTFQRLAETFRHRLVLVMAKNGESLIGGTMNIRKEDALYGRYWGATQHYEFLHFECCFYRLIEYAIEQNIRLFEAGAQGEQKFLRGFGTVPTYSAHLIFHPAGRDYVERYLAIETPQVIQLIDNYNKISPLKHLR